MKKETNILRSAHQEMQELKHLLGTRKTLNNIILSLSIATSLCMLGAMISASDRLRTYRTRITTKKTQGK